MQIKEEIYQPFDKIVQDENCSRRKAREKKKEAKSISRRKATGAPYYGKEATFRSAWRANVSRNEKVEQYLRSFEWKEQTREAMSILTSDFVWNVVERDELVKQLADCLFFSEEKSERREPEAAAETLHR